METFRIKLSDLIELADPPKSGIAGFAEISALVLKRFGFLPQPVVVQLDGDEVVISFPAESASARAEAMRLAERAAKRAAEGKYDQAISVFKRVLALCPSLHSARRDLAMCYVELGDVENALSHLIDVLRVLPNDAWSLVVLGNLYISKKSDKKTGEKFLRKALEISPTDAWALNSLAAVCHEQGKSEEAIRLFEQAIAANPEFANAYYGEALAYDAAQKPDAAVATLNRMFARAKAQDARSRSVFAGSRQLFAKLQSDLAERNQSESFKLVQNYKAELETLSGYPIRISDEDFNSHVGATIQMAWKHGRDFHLVKVRTDYPPPLVSHLKCHEFTHLKLESEARRVGRNLFFTTTPKSREVAVRSLAGDVQRLAKSGLSDDRITELTLTMVSGLAGFLFNCPLDMQIERHIHAHFEALRPAQFLSVRKMALEAAQTNNNPEIRRITPRRIFQASLALNGAYALFLDDLFGGASELAGTYRSTDAFGMAQRLWKHWQQGADSLGAGEEYRMVDDFADMLGLRGWYEWRPDSGHHESTPEPVAQGTTNPALLKEKHPAAVFYFLDAFERFDTMTASQVRTVTFEIAMLGREGLDYSSGDEKYELRSLPERKFSGLHLMCLMYAGFKRIAPDQDPGMDLNDPFLTALQMHKPRGK